MEHIVSASDSAVCSSVYSPYLVKEPFISSQQCLMAKVDRWTIYETCFMRI